MSFKVGEIIKNYDKQLEKGFKLCPKCIGRGLVLLARPLKGEHKRIADRRKRK